MAAMLVSQGKKRCGSGKEIAKKKTKTKTNKKTLVSHLSLYVNVINVVFFIEAVLDWLVYWDGLLSRLIWRYTFPILVCLLNASA